MIGRLLMGQPLMPHQVAPDEHLVSMMLGGKTIPKLTLSQLRFFRSLFPFDGRFKVAKPPAPSGGGGTGGTGGGDSHPASPGYGVSTYGSGVYGG